MRSNSGYLFFLGGLCAFLGIVFLTVPDFGWAIFCFAGAAITFFGGRHVRRNERAKAERYGA